MLPYPGIPYGVAPGWCFPVFELSMFVLLALCIVHAFRRHREAIPYIVGGFLFGVLLEYMEVVGHSYIYGRFLLMAGHAPLNVPLCIGAGWAIILYTSRLFSDSFALPLWAAAALDTLLALNIDLSMDVVAYRLHMWHWFWDDTSRALTSQWFGIPYGNFNGWATVVFCYSAFSRIFERRLLKNNSGGVIRRSIVAALALLCSLGMLFATETYLYPFLRNAWGITSGIRLSLIVIALLVLAISGWRKRKTAVTNPVAITTWVPGWFHGYFAFCFFVLGFYRESHWMTMAALLNILLGMAIHLLPFRLPGHPFSWRSNAI
ncbi:carotenoid biosynthesis protein [Silvibacterium acidisoli]|uniref:carotenoid biosynthesis protein n=1 Tax=Acidobacteriaceae bacterium ZG23-2 TaxID=2883246 RepID=UPI00406D0493